MQFYTNLFSPRTYRAFTESNQNISGFRERQIKMAERISIGDRFICYVTKLSRWVGILEVRGDPFIDTTPIFYREDDPFTLRFEVEPIVWLSEEYTVPIRENVVWNTLSFTQQHDKRSSAWTGQVRSSLKLFNPDDAEFLQDLLLNQQQDPIKYPLSEEDIKKFAKHEIKRSDRTVQVTVPDTEMVEAYEAPSQKTEIRESIQVQATLARIGARMGFSIWIPANDRARVASLLEPIHQQALREVLPLNYDETTIDTIERIDILWLKNRSIVRAFEVEHTTAIYSGILRMADLAALQPNMDIRLHIVAPEDRKEQVFREISRPVFALLEKGPLYEYCTYISYDSLRELEQAQHLDHMTDTVLTDFEEEVEF